MIAQTCFSVIYPVELQKLFWKTTLEEIVSSMTVKDIHAGRKDL